MGDDVTVMALKNYLQKEKLLPGGLYFTKLPKGVPIPPSGPSNRHNEIENWKRKRKLPTCLFLVFLIPKFRWLQGFAGLTLKDVKATYLLIGVVIGVISCNIVYEYLFVCYHRISIYRLGGSFS